MFHTRLHDTDATATRQGQKPNEYIYIGEIDFRRKGVIDTLKRGSGREF